MRKTGKGRGGRTKTERLMTPEPKVSPRGKKNRSIISPQKIRDAPLMGQALELRGQGLSFKAIGQKLGVPRNKAWELVWQGFKSFAPEGDEDLRGQELARLQLLEDAVWANAMKGHIPSVMAALSVHEKRCLILGIRAPVKIDLEVAGQVSVAVDEAWAKTRALVEAGGPALLEAAE